MSYLFIQFNVLCSFISLCALRSGLALAFSVAPSLSLSLSIIHSFFLSSFSDVRKCSKCVVSVCVCVCALCKRVYEMYLCLKPLAVHHSDEISASRII